VPDYRPDATLVVVQYRTCCLPADRGGWWRMTLAATARGPTLLFRATPWSDRSVRRVFELAPTHTLSKKSKKCCGA